MAHVKFFLVIQEDRTEKLPEIVELQPVPQWTPDPCVAVGSSTDTQRPLMSPPYVLGRGSPCLYWALKNSVACSRRLLDFTTWYEPADQAGTRPNRASSAHPSTPQCAVRVCCKDRNRMVCLRRANAAQSNLSGGREKGDRTVLGEGGVAWLHVGDSLTVAETVSITLGALQLLTVATERAVETDSGSSSGPLCWFAGSDVGSGSSSNSNDSSTKPLSTSRDRAGPSSTAPPSLPQVGIRPSIQWQHLPRLTRQEMMLTCWLKWVSSCRSPVPSSTSLPPAQSPVPLSISVARTTVSASRAATMSEKGVQTSPTLLPLALPHNHQQDGGASDMVLVETVPPVLTSASSRSSTTAGGINGDAEVAVGEVYEAATPSNSQAHTASATAVGQKRPVQRNETAGGFPTEGTRRQQVQASQEPLPSPRSTSSSLSFFSAPSRQQQSGDMVGTDPCPDSAVNRCGHESRASVPKLQGSSGLALPTSSQTVEAETLGSGSRYTYGETLDANLDDAFAALEQRADQLDYLALRPDLLLGEENSEESDGGALSGGAPRRSRPMEAKTRPSSSPSREGTRKSEKQGRGSASGTPRKCQGKRPRRRTTTDARSLQRSSSVTADRRTNRTTGSRGSPEMDMQRTSSRMRRSDGGMAASGLFPLPLSATNDNSISFKVNSGKGSGALRFGDESQEVYYQH